MDNSKENVAKYQIEQCGHLKQFVHSVLATAWQDGITDYMVIEGRLSSSIGPGVLEVSGPNGMTLAIQLKTEELTDVKAESQLRECMLKGYSNGMVADMHKSTFYKIEGNGDKAVLKRVDEFENELDFDTIVGRVSSIELR